MQRKEVNGPDDVDKNAKVSIIITAAVRAMGMVHSNKLISLRKYYKALIEPSRNQKRLFKAYLRKGRPG